MRTKNLTQTEREKLVFFLGGYNDDEFYTFYHFAMDMFLKDLGYPAKEREKIKGINVFRQWFNEQFEKRDEYIIEKMLIYDKENFDCRFTEGYYNYPFYDPQQFKQYYQLLHQDFTHYDKMPFEFNYKHNWGLKKPQQIAWVRNYQCPFCSEKFTFYFHFS